MRTECTYQPPYYLTSTGAGQLAPGPHAQYTVHRSPPPPQAAAPPCSPRRYAAVAKALRESGAVFRTLALSATAGVDLSAVHRGRRPTPALQPHASRLQSHVSNLQPHAPSLQPHVPSLQPYVSQVQRVVDMLHLSQVELLTEDDPELLAHTHIKHVEVRVVPIATKCKGACMLPGYHPL